MLPTCHRNKSEPIYFNVNAVYYPDGDMKETILKVRHPNNGQILGGVGFKVPFSSVMVVGWGSRQIPDIREIILLTFDEEPVTTGRLQVTYQYSH